MDDSNENENNGKQVFTYERTYPLLPVKLAEGGFRWLWPTYFLITWNVDSLGTATYSGAKYVTHADLTAVQLSSESRVIHVKQLNDF